ncbi:MAG: 50S ribosomal protein L21 [Thermoguttaceae bacterium]|nr:50S ribosomal protein L21 [Thermoguttaceae bacterium]MBQ3333323.1 50S ribosomal protein L21 [Thermoguttaceae bacterium]MBQ3453687.1 50S ribosomal protein L21 [Thermoguttaceae bacterium]MBQ6619197.1 50S ribosomal protein L21 [Thermoguttaceae bacterium]MBR2585067.1 50S ribosomal protein L21 [Thermoguttaceae bacterium]
MYAIFRDGGHQYKAEVGKEMYVDVRDIEPGVDLVFDEVLALSDGEGNVTIGQPMVAGAKVVAEVMCKAKGPKLVIRWFRRRKNSRKKTGHRQTYIKIKIKEIVG